jgi:heptosyltransferase-2
MQTLNHDEKIRHSPRMPGSRQSAHPASGIEHRASGMTKPKLLVLELWGIGDVIIASPFLREACRNYQVTLLAQGFAMQMGPAFWPEVEVLPFRMPWIVHRGKYRLHTWPWPALARLVKRMRQAQFDIAVSARWDPRDDMVMLLSGARRRVGFPRMGSQFIETESLGRPEPVSHRLERWRVIGSAIGLEVPPITEAVHPVENRAGAILIHSGAGKQLRVWPLERFHALVTRFRAQGYTVQVACDPEQAEWWMTQSEANVTVPTDLKGLLELVNGAGVFIGNDSGPGHVAAYLGIPTFTLFGPQVPEWFVPMHPQAEWIEGTPCPYKPCFDYCEFPEPFCLTGITEEQAATRVEAFVKKHLDPRR